MNIGPYTLVREVGRGGMGVVYKARDTARNRTVAIKIIHKSAAMDPQRRMGLVREARAAGSLRHPNILEIYDIDQHKGSLYLVMEYLHGASLNRVIASGYRLSMSRKLHILIELCDALDYAHSNGVIHRDVKPGNIFVTRDRIIKVVDFGLALQEDLPGTKGIAGTIPYLAPEQLRGAKADSGSDLWAAGITMYELLTGRLPFSGPDVVRQIVSSAVPALDLSLPLAGDLNRVLSRALSKQKEERYPTARSFAADLRYLETALAIGPNATVDSIEPILIEGDVTCEGNPVQPKPQILGPQQPQAQQAEYLHGLELGFRCATSGPVSIRIGKFPLRLELRKTTAVLGELFSWVIPFAFVSFPFVLGVFVLVIFLAVKFWYVTLPLLLLAGAMKAAELMARVPRCLECHLPMAHTAHWTRFVRSRTEVSMGYQDCMAALKEGLWQEAAKLLNVHSSEPSSFLGAKLISTPLRYHLDFFECAICGHHAARMTADTVADDVWIPGVDFTEAYQGTKCASVSPFAVLGSAVQRTIGALATSIRQSGTIRIHGKIVALGAAALVLVLVFSGFSALHNRAHKINSDNRTTVSTRSGAPIPVAPAIVARNEGLAYYNAWNRPLDRQRALWLFQTAAKQGDAFSANMLGTMYEKGYGAPQNVDRALAWYKEAAQQGNSDAALNLGRLYENGIGVLRDVSAAMHWYGLAADAGNKEAVERIAHLRSK